MQHNRQKISTFQAVVLVTHSITPTAMLILPSIAIGAASQDAWISVAAAWGCGIVIAILIGSICRLNPGLPFLTLIENRLGRAVGIVAGLLLVQYYMLSSSIILREFVDFLSDEVMKKTPVIVLAATALLVALYAVREGIEVVARIGVIVFVGSTVFIIVGISLQMNNVNLKHLLPIGEASFPQIVLGGLSSFGWISEASVLMLLSPYLSKPTHARRIAVWGTSIAGFELLLAVVMVLLIFGPELPKLLKYPTIITMEIIKYGSFLERIEFIFICLWIASLYIKLCIYFYGTVHFFVHLFRIRNKKPFPIALGILVLLTSLYTWSSNTYLTRHNEFTFFPYLAIMNVFLPLALWIGLKRKTGKTISSGG
ncbi:endospore germination permease [Cohnella suwonensis]|uniref:Endospore germination permease n=1 Tax=Cohnella suwonensis TaxID=696072 RepID=A0ABW0LY73_9BACL